MEKNSDPGSTSRSRNTATGHSYVPTNLPGGNDEAAEYVDEGDEGGGSGEPLHRIGGMVAAPHQQKPAHSCDTCNTTYLVLNIRAYIHRPWSGLSLECLP
jgi:hypothetical protein